MAGREAPYLLTHHVCAVTRMRAAVTVEYVRRRDGKLRIQCQGCGSESYVSPETARMLEENNEK